jgi:L-serine dehydratase
MKWSEAPDADVLKTLQSRSDLHGLKTFSPVLPVPSRKSPSVPFLTAEAMEITNKALNLELWELASMYECSRGGLAEGIPLKMMEEIVNTLDRSISEGLKGTEYEDRILGFQSGQFQAAAQNGTLFDAGLFNTAIRNITALMEIKSAMGLIVAAPTAGSCGCLPGTLFAANEALGLSAGMLPRAFLSAGLIGVFIGARTPLTAEVSGCQAECGASSGMTAAALVAMMGGSLKQSLAAASMALQNTLGMICDPVAKRVEIPCLGRNVMAAGNAIACANMALAGFDPVIPLDEVIGVMDSVGRSLPRELRCTGLGGLSVTPTSCALERKLENTSETEVENKV